MQLKSLHLTSAYLIGRKAAENMSVIPICVPIDHWNFFYNKKYFSSLRVYYPISTKIKYFISLTAFYKSQDIKVKNLKGWIVKNITKYKIPLLYSYLQYHFSKKYYIKYTNFVLTDKISPIYKHSINKESD